ncbi:glycerophosphodiester phosphodiesterase family protein [Sagittula salina]|uniref:Phosphodiesterase n=1 Tax=Sagittula salina TaxID=2820268 RepID=A0A940S458_9RHOB|nr:glycerophosphodiester phosphodiesterase family protein [Sagittula salina]MBP0483754.1 phosphodiesterase [Sagittula salina]
MMLPKGFLDRPVAHRALHDRAAGRPENSRAAVRAAVEADYAIEIDLQMSADGVPMVFHDYQLQRLTGETGALRQRDAAALGAIRLTDAVDGIPTFVEVLEIVGGRVPLLVEVKDQDGAMGPDVGPLEAAAASALRGYDGPLALMSFNPHSVEALGRLCPDRPVGLTSCAGTAEDYPTLPREAREALGRLEMADAMRLDFISHDHRDLHNPRVAELKARGVRVLCWTIRSPAEEAAARKIAENITFEGYRA